MAHNKKKSSLGLTNKEPKKATFKLHNPEPPKKPLPDYIIQNRKQ